MLLLALLVCAAAAAELTPLQLAALREKQRVALARQNQTVAAATTARAKFTMPPKKPAFAAKPTAKPPAKPKHNADVPEHLAHRYNKRDDMHVAHCLGADDARELQNHKLEAAEKRLPPPRTRILWPQIDVLEVEVTLPYVADAFRYVLSFSPVQIDHVSDRPLLDTRSECSSFYKATRSSGSDADYDTSDDAEPQPQDWVFAPNALYPDAFGPDYSANYVSDESMWRVQAVDCAHMRYTVKVPLQQLLECDNAATLVKAHNNTALLTTLQVTGVMAGHNALAYLHEYSIAVYSDSQGNAAMLFDSSSTNAKPFGSALMRSLSIVDDKLSLQLQTVSESGPLRLSAVTPRYSSGDGALATSPSLHAATNEADTYGSGLQNWDFVAQLSETMFTGQYVMQFEAADANDTLLVGLMFRIDNAPAATRDQLAGIHGAVATHKHSDKAAHSGKFAHNDFVCMQSYVLIGNDLEQHIQVDLLDAALCPAEHTDACREHQHGVVLFADGEAQRSDVQLVWPGAYGENSVALCFNASATLVDGENRSRVYERQRYEARVVIRAHNAAARQASLAWQLASGGDEQPEHLKQRAKLIKSQIVKTGDFTSGNLENSLLDARAAQLLEEYETQFTEFEIERSENSVYNVSNDDALIVTGLILAIVIVVVAVYAVLVYSRSRRANKVLADALDQRYKAVN